MVFQSESGFILIFVFFFSFFVCRYRNFGWFQLCAKIVPATLQLSDDQVNFTFNNKNYSFLKEIIYIVIRKELKKKKNSFDT